MGSSQEEGEEVLPGRRAWMPLPPKGWDTITGHGRFGTESCCGERGVTVLEERLEVGLSCRLLLHLKASALSFVKLAAPILPPLVLSSTVAGVAHRFHSTCGKNIALEEDGTRAVRQPGYAHGLVFSTKELKTEEIFEVAVADDPGPPTSMAGPACLPSSCIALRVLLSPR